jgi:hypothetical protein
MSAIGTKRTSLFAPQMSANDPKRTWLVLKIAFAVAIRGKADMPFCTANVR